MADFPSERAGPDDPGDRRSAILDAAERCFVRSGFHRTTMQDVATEAGMSPGNIYRYFLSKHDLIVGIAERDRAELSESFEPLTKAEDLVATFLQGGRRHFLDFPMERAILCLEIWAEATRDPEVRRVNVDFDQDIMQRMDALFIEAQRRGQIQAGIDTRGITRLVMLLADGLFVRQGLERDFNAEREVGDVFAVIEALIRGAVRLPPSERRAESEK